MSNQETMTLAHAQDQANLELKAFKLEQKRKLLMKETSLFNAFRERVNAGEFPSKDAALEEVDSVFGACVSPSTKGALEAFLSINRDWAGAHKMFDQRLKAAGDLEAEWAVARLHLLNHLGSDFIRSWSFEDGQLPADALHLHQLASCWHRDGYIGNVNAYVNITPEGGATYKLVISNPQRVKGQRDPRQRNKPKTKKD